MLVEVSFEQETEDFAKGVGDGITAAESLPALLDKEPDGAGQADGNGARVTGKECLRVFHGFIQWAKSHRAERSAVAPQRKPETKTSAQASQLSSASWCWSSFSVM